MSEGSCGKLPMWQQGTLFSIDAFVLVLAGWDVVLGVQWLRTLGDVMWNFEELNMQFAYLGKLEILKGLKQLAWVEESYTFKLKGLEKKDALTTDGNSNIEG